MTLTRKKLIEVALPLDAINAACKPESENPFLKGHPRSLHNWWARLPLVVSRTMVFASLVDDPGGFDLPDAYLQALDRLPPPEPLPLSWDDMALNERRRRRLMAFVARLADWNSAGDEHVLATAQELIELSCEGKVPPVLDPFCGRGSIPLEAQRLGLEAHGSDLNPIAVLICKALIEIPPKFVGMPPVNSIDRAKLGGSTAWKAATGLSADIRHYGRWMRAKAEERLGHLYPSARRPDGSELPVAAWLWARTIKCPNPGCLADIPLVKSFQLAKRGAGVSVQPSMSSSGRHPRFDIVSGTAAAPTVAGSAARCLACSTLAPFEHVKTEGMAGRMGMQLMAVVGQKPRGKTYLPREASEVPEFSKGETAAVRLASETFLAGATPERLTGGTCYGYGLTTWGSLFTPRQILALSVLGDLVAEARAQVHLDAIAAGLPDETTPLSDGGTGALAYADAIAIYLSCAVSRLTDYHCSLCTWNPTNENVRDVFVRQALPMTWDFAEANPIRGKLSMEVAADWVADALGSVVLGPKFPGTARPADATKELPFSPESMVVATDPPYYDNIGYADLSDFFYVWLRRMTSSFLPQLFETVLTPKGPEIVASPYKHKGGASEAHRYFTDSLTRAFERIREVSSATFPSTVVYAYKQDDLPSGDEPGAGSGWEAMLETLIRAGFSLSGSWPMRTTKQARAVAQNTNALASAVVLVCRPRRPDAPTATRSEFLDELSAAMKAALPTLSSGDVAPVDLAQASIGPGMGVYSRFRAVLRQDGKPVTVADALQDINNAISAYRSERTSSFDPKTRFCIDFYDQFGFQETLFDNATVLARAQAVGVNTLESEHLLMADGGRAKLVALGGYPVGVAGLERRFSGSAWEACMRLAATLQEDGERATAALARELGEGVCARARELAVWLYTIAAARKRSQDAVAFNALDASWPEVQRLLAAMDRGGEQGRFA